MENLTISLSWHFIGVSDRLKKIISFMPLIHNGIKIKQRATNEKQ